MSLRYTVILGSCAAVCGCLWAREPKTVITGDQMEIRQGGATVVFSGNSKVTRGDSVLSADTLVQDKARNRVEASGSIRFRTLTQDRESIYGRGEKAIYDTEKGYGEFFEGRPTVVYEAKASSGPVRVTADSITFDQKKDEVLARGNVEIHTSSGSAYAPQAMMRQQEKRLVLSGPAPQPSLVYPQEGRTSVFSADTVTVALDSKRVTLEGNVHGKLRSKELEKQRR